MWGQDKLLFIDGLGEDENVIKIDYHMSFCDELLKDVIHHGLESGWTVGEAKEYDKRFE